MISRYKEIQYQTNELKEILKSSGIIQKIYTTSRYLCLRIRFVGKTLSIFIGRGGGYEGIWISSISPESYLRKRDKWLDWCRSHLSSTTIYDIELDPIDRIVCLKMMKRGQPYNLYIAWIGRSCYFALWNQFEKKWFLSWSDQSSELESFEIFDEVGRKQSTEGDYQLETSLIESLLDKEKDDAQINKKAKKESKKLKTKIQKIQQDLDKIRNYQKIQEWIDANEAETLASLEKIKLAETIIKFPSAATVWQKRGILFDKIKKLKQAETKQLKRLKDCESDAVSTNESKSVENSLKTINPVWLQKSEKKTKQTINSDFKILEFEKFQIGIGLSAKGNDQLRKTWGKSEDIWIHIENRSSSHGIIKCSQEIAPTIQMIKKAAELIAKQSGITATSFDIIYTPLKNVKGVSGTAGMVTYKKQKVLRVEIENQ